MSKENKRYYWIQLAQDFFKSKEMKLLRKIAGGDTYTIIYLKLMLMSLEDSGKIYYDGIAENLAEEIGLVIDENIEDIKLTLAFLESKGLLTKRSEREYFLEQVPEMVGSETASTRRSRKHREQKTLQCNAVATIGNGEKEKEKEEQKRLEAERVKEKERQQKEEAEKKDKQYRAMATMYFTPALMTSAYLISNEISNAPIARLIEGKEANEPLKEVVENTPEGTTYADLIREEIRFTHPSLPELPTDRQREEIIEDFLRQPSVELSEGQRVNAQQPLLVTMSIPNNDETRHLLEERSVDFKSSQETLSYNALVRYREGLKIEGTEENKRVLDDLGISATPLKNNKLFVPLDGSPEVGKLMTRGIKAEVTYGMAELPVLRKESLEERIGRSGITDGDSRSLLLKGESLIVENDRGNKSLVYIDQTTNQVRSIPTSQLPIPNRISSLPLQFDELPKLRSDGYVELFDKREHVYHRVALDVRESDNFKMEYKELSSEKYKPVPTVESSDKEKIDYIALRGAKAIDDIWGKEALKKERDSFLERYNVQETYREYLDLKKQGEPGSTIRQNEEIKEVFKHEQRKEQQRGLSV